MMETGEELEQTLGEIAPEGWSVSVADDGTRTLESEDTAVDFLLVAGDVPQLHVRAKAGEVPEKADADLLFEDLLAGNFLWRDTAGATLSLHGGAVYLNARRETGDFADREEFTAFVERFVDQVFRWRERIKLTEGR